MGLSRVPTFFWVCFHAKAFRMEARYVKRTREARATVQPAATRVRVVRPPRVLDVGGNFLGKGVTEVEERKLKAGKK